MASLRVSLEESQEAKLELEKKLKDERERADTVGIAATRVYFTAICSVGWANACRLESVRLQCIVYKLANMCVWL